MQNRKIGRRTVGRSGIIALIGIKYRYFTEKGFLFKMGIMKITRIQAEAGVWKPKVDGQVVPDYLKALCTYDLA